MIDPRISLAAQAPDISNALQMFNNSLNSAQNRRSNQQLNQQQAALLPGQLQAQQQNLDINQSAMNTQAENENLISIGATIPQLRDFISNGDSLGALSFLNSRNQDLIARGRSEQERGETLEAIEIVTNGNLDQLGQELDVVEQEISARGLSTRQAGTASQKDFQAFQQLNQKAIETGAAEDIIAAQQFGKQSGFSRPSIQQQQQNTIDTAQRLAGVEVSKQEEVSQVKAAAARESVLKTEYSTQNKNAARSMIKIRQARKLAGITNQGIQGVGKVALARLFPDIDVSNEATLAQAFKSLALDELQKFKGPTTDFEFSVTEDITGSLGDGQSANLARLASLERSAWFAQRESKQFRDWEKAGHDTDAFSFDFNEVITIPKKDKKLTYKLIDLQDTAVENQLSIEEVIEALGK